MSALIHNIKSKGIFTTITNKSTNHSSFNQGIFQPHSKKLINKSKRDGLKVFTNNRGESFISIPIYH